MLNGVRRHSRSLRVRLMAWYGGVMAALLVLFALLLYALLAVGLNQELDRALRVRSDDIATSLNGDDWASLKEDLTPVPGVPVRNDLTGQSQEELALIYGPDGILVEASGPRLDPIPDSVRAAGSRYVTQAGDRAAWRLYARSLTLTGGTGTLLVGRSLAGTEATLQQTVWAMLVAGPLLLLLACGGGYFLAGRALAPLQRINQTARQIQAQDLSLRIGAGAGTGEIAELAHTIDAMLERLEQAFMRQRRFTADAAHELRTPLAVLTAEASLALQRPRRPAEYQQALLVIGQESERLRVLLQNLLTLARAEQGTVLGLPCPPALSAVCAQAISGVTHQAEANGIQIAVDQVGDPLVWGDPIWLAQLLGNLLDNAVKYSPPGGLVQLRLGAVADSVYLAVADNGSGIAVAHLPHIFGRFYRADAARSRDSAQAGAGLGLAICHWIAEAHGGTITAANVPGQGACFTVRLPCYHGVVVPKSDAGQDSS